MIKIKFFQRNISSRLNFNKLSFFNFNTGIKTIDLIKILRAETSNMIITI